MHDLEMNDDGTANMFFVGRTPWHGLGVKLEKPPSTKEAITAAGLDWTVEKRPLHLQNEDESFREVAYYANVRTSDNAILGYVGPGYHCLQNEDAFSFFDPFVEEGSVTLDTAGSLKGGRRVWVLGRVNTDPVEIAKDDTIERFVLLSNSHDGTLAIRAGFTAIRVVCNNTLQYAVGARSSKLLRVRHSANAEKALSDIQDIMKVADSEFEASVEKMRSLVRHGVNADDVREYVRRVFQPKVVIPGAEEEPQRKQLVDNIIPLFEEGRGNDLPGVRGTMWAAYNAVTEYVSHERGRTQDNRIDSVWFGEGAKVAQRALDIATKMVAVG